MEQCHIKAKTVGRIIAVAVGPTCMPVFPWGEMWTCPPCATSPNCSVHPKLIEKTINTLFHKLAGRKKNKKQNKTEQKFLP
ncbi:hypothetical protein TorRG33x02_025640 [Trema orientale]|uniref:Uncharacterized protein n=1 Tax=Trema orientale TaxID=63057 RepID=A0A2P5FVK5_TREOI|nr:hypothetical protein TorRG33x02_025640 [Trema orientale]